MLLLALAAALPSAQPPARRPGAAIEQARASVRIVRGARVGRGHLPDEALVRQAVIRAADGSQTHLRIVEFP
ncbi:MAG TPA: hypothetical protein VFP53_00680 [Sphingomicrobium sp.]|nr:hypothetical protein [Sphingomicrobium sp.]